MPNTLTRADIIEAIQKENGYSRKQSTKVTEILFAFAWIPCSLLQGCLAGRTAAKLFRAKPGWLRRNSALITRLPMQTEGSFIRNHQTIPRIWRGCNDIRLRQIPGQNQAATQRPQPGHQWGSDTTTQKSRHIQKLRQTKKPNQQMISRLSHLSLSYRYIENASLQKPSISRSNRDKRAYFS